MAKLNSKSFLDNFSKNLIAANVNVPDMKTGFNKMVDYPECHIKWKKLCLNSRQANLNQEEIRQ